MSDLRRHLHPIYELVERSLRASDRRRGRLPFVVEESPSLSRHQALRLVIVVAIHVLDQQLHRQYRQLGVVFLQHLLAEHDGVDPGGYLPRGPNIPELCLEVRDLLGHPDGPELDLQIMRFIRQAAHQVVDGPAFLAFLDGQILRAELTTLGLPTAFVERVAGATPVFRGPGVWLYRESHGGLVLACRRGDTLDVLDGSDEDVLASVPDACFAAAVAVVRG